MRNSTAYVRAWPVVCDRPRPYVRRPAQRRDFMTLCPTDVLRELVAIPSVNPMGRPARDEICYEHRLTGYLESFFRRERIDCVRQAVEPRRDNLLAWVPGEVPPRQGGRIVLFEVHQDTVPVDGMTIDPFAAEVRRGRLYGRGACDVKGGMAAMLAAMVRLARERPGGRPTVVLAATVNEEFGFTGATALCKLLPGGGEPFSRLPDVAVVAEPTELQVVVAHKGVLRWRCHTRGRAVHSSQPQLGVNAIYAMSHVVQALERYQQEIASGIVPHARCGPATLCVSTIAGGISVNTVPDSATIEIDRRLLPDEDPDVVYRDVVAYVAENVPGDVAVQHDPAFGIGRGLSDQGNNHLAEALSHVAGEVCGPAPLVGVPYGTDASVIAAAGVPTVVFGPGSLDQAHTADEWIDLDQLQAASEVYYRFACSGPAAEDTCGERGASAP